MELTQFNNFKELISTPVSESEHTQILQIIDDIYNTSYSNQTWIGVILDFLNDNKEDKYYSEYYLTPDFYGSRKYIYRFISTEEDKPCSITDTDVQVLRRLNAQPQFVLYDYEEEPSDDIFAYLEQSRTLKKVLESIGMTKELKEHLCEFCFYRFKDEMLKKQQEEITGQQKSVLSKENIELLFKNHDFKYILKVVSICYENSNAELLNLISLNAQDLLSNPNANIFNKQQIIELFKKTGCYPCDMEWMDYKELVDFYNDSIVRCCEDILVKIISVCCDNYECFGYILEQLYKSKNSNVRLHCCGKGDYTKFLNDPLPRVAKVANIRYNFDKKWNSLSDDDNEKQRINFLISALENHHIYFYLHDTFVGEDKIDITFMSSLFEKSENQSLFDHDIYDTIRDVRILADALNELIKQDEIILKDEIAPECFKKENSVLQEQRRPVLSRKIIPSMNMSNE